MDDHTIIYVLIFINVILIFYIMTRSTEGFASISEADAEAISNIASIYNSGEMTVNKLNVIDTLQISDKVTMSSDGEITANKLTVADSINVSNGKVKIGTDTWGGNVDIYNEKDGRALYLSGNYNNLGGSIFYYDPENLRGEYKYGVHIHGNGEGTFKEGTFGEVSTRGKYVNPYNGSFLPTDIGHSCDLSGEFAKTYVSTKDPDGTTVNIGNSDGSTITYVKRGDKIGCAKASAWGGWKRNYNNAYQYDLTDSPTYSAIPF